MGLAPPERHLQNDRVLFVWMSPCSCSWFLCSTHVLDDIYCNNQTVTLGLKISKPLRWQTQTQLRQLVQVYEDLSNMGTKTSIVGGTHVADQPNCRIWTILVHRTMSLSNVLTACLWLRLTSVLCCVVLQPTRRWSCRRCFNRAS